MQFPRPSLPTRAERTLLPAALAGVLAILVASQLALTGDVTLPDAGAIGGGARGAALPDAGAFAAAPVIAARPIFAPRGGSGASDSADAAAPADPLGGTVIAGSVTGRRTYAVVQSPDGATRRVAIGGGIAGWRLLALSATGARLARGGERLTVAYGSKAASNGDTPEAEDVDQP